MLTDEYLLLQSVRLRNGDEWNCEGIGLSLVFVKAGKGKHVGGEAVQEVAAHDVLVLDCRTGGKLCAGRSSEMTFVWFSLGLQQLLPLFAAGEIPLLQSITNKLEGCKVYRASSDIARECQRLLATVPHHFDLGHRSHLLRVAATVLAAELKEARARSSDSVRTNAHLARVFESLGVEEILASPVAALAKRFGCSARHLNRLFHLHFGLSVAALRMELRLLKAASLLRNPDCKIVSVAEECGLNHPGRFNAFFKRRFGVTPGQWRDASHAVDYEIPAARNLYENCRIRAAGLCPLIGCPCRAPGSNGKPALVASSGSESSRPGNQDSSILACLCARASAAGLKSPTGHPQT